MNFSLRITGTLKVLRSKPSKLLRKSSTLHYTVGPVSSTLYKRLVYRSQRSRIDEGENAGYQVLRGAHDLLIMRVRRKVPTSYWSYTQIHDLRLNEMALGASIFQ